MAGIGIVTQRAAVAAGLVVAIAVGALVACGRPGGIPPKDATLRAQDAGSISSSAASKRAAEARAPARSHLVATIGRKAIGPFAARARDGGIVAWIAAADRGGGAELVVVPFGVDGAPLRDPRVVASVPRDATSLIVRPTGRNRGGWLLVWSALLDRGESITLLELAQDGTVRGAPAEVQRTSDHVAWVDLIPTPRGALCIWAEDTVGSNANVLVSAIDSDGKPLGMPARVARGVARWAAIRAKDGAALALVTRPTGATAGSLSWLQLDADGGAIGHSIAIGKEPTVSGDVEIVSSQDKWLVLWTDRTGEDSQISLATVDLAGTVQGPVRAMNAVGGSSLVNVASGDAGIALLWEGVRSRSRPSRTLNLATVSTAGGLSAQPVSSLDVLSLAPLEFIATKEGFALLATPARACDGGNNNESGAKCPGAVPIVLRYDAHLAPLQTEHLLVGATPTPAALAWGLQCAEDRCVALAASGATPTPVFAIDLPRRTSPFDAPGPPLAAPPGAPQATGLVTLASEQPFADLAAARVGDTTFVATLASAAEKAAGRARGRNATIAVRPFDDNGRPLEVASVITTRALPVGGVAIAGSTIAPLEAAAAWVSREDSDARVHVARLDMHAHRTKEAQLTNTKADAGSIAIAPTADGWIVAWVDARDGNGEVYATKVDRNLNRVAPDRRITRAPGDAADVSLATSGETAWLAWSDPRESPREGIGDVYVTTLSTRDAKRSGDEVRVLATAAHSRSPELVAMGSEALLAWIEDAPTGLEAAGSAMIARLDDHGRLSGVPTAIRLAGAGRPTAIVVGAPDRASGNASSGAARAVIARAAYDGVTLDALKLMAGDQQGPPWAVVDLEAPPSFDTALALAGGALFYDDTGARPEDHRIRRLAISW